jgi:polyisoprenoid-binding protein YceI
MRHVLFALVIACLSASAATADTFTFDKAHTEVRASWDHLGLSRQSARFSDVAGKLVFDPEKPEAASVEVAIKVASVMTGVAALDTHLVKTKDYFDAAAHPVITFKSSQVRSTGDKTAEMTGDLTINGIAKPVVLAVVWNYLGPHPLGTVNPTLKDQIVAGFSARTQILRSEWGIVRTIPLVSDEIRISIEAELQKDP